MKKAKKKASVTRVLEKVHSRHDVMLELKIPSNRGTKGYTAQYRPSGVHSRAYR